MVKVTMTSTSEKGEVLTLEAECPYAELSGVVVAMCGAVGEFHAKLG